jgi:hypothetical protein
MQRSDPGGVQEAIDRYRDLAKYLIGILAAIGALLVAGTQLSSIGELSWSDDRTRLLASGIGLAVALVAVIWIIRRALDILRPIDLSLKELAANKRLAAAVESEPELFQGAGGITVLAALLESPILPPAERESWVKVANGILDRAAFLEMRWRFDRAWREMVGAAIIGAAGITVLAWAANPPKEAGEAAGPLVAPLPTPVLVSLTNGGRAALGEALGERCPEPIPGLVIGGSQVRPIVVTTRADTKCNPAQFVLSPTWGHARNVTRAER